MGEAGRFAYYEMYSIVGAASSLHPNTQAKLLNLSGTARALYLLLPFKAQVLLNSATL